MYIFDYSLFERQKSHKEWERDPETGRGKRIEIGREGGKQKGRKEKKERKKRRKKGRKIFFPVG